MKNIAPNKKEIIELPSYTEICKDLESFYSQEIIKQAEAVWKIIANKHVSDTKLVDKQRLFRRYMEYFCQCIQSQETIQFVKLGLPFDHKGEGYIDYAEIDYFERIASIASKITQGITEVYQNGKKSVKFNILADGNLMYLPGINSPDLVAKYQEDCKKYIQENNIPIEVIDLIEYIKKQNLYVEYENFYNEFLTNPDTHKIEDYILNIYINRLKELKITDLGNSFAIKLAASYQAHSYAREKIELLPFISKLGIGLTGIVRKGDSRLNFTTLPHTDYAPERVALVWDPISGKKTYYPHKSYTNTKGEIIQGIDIMLIKGELNPIYNKSNRLMYYAKNCIKNTQK